MLAVMSYNGGVLLTLVFGLSIGNFVSSYFNLKKSVNSFGDDQGDELGKVQNEQAGYNNVLGDKKS